MRKSYSLKILLLSSFLLVSCQLNPDTSIEGVWENYEYIYTTSGYGVTYYKQCFIQGYYHLTISTYNDIDNFPGSLSSTEQYDYRYVTGYQSPKFAIVLQEYEEPYTSVVPTIYYYFDGDELVTSTNSNMAIPKRWTKIY